MLAVYNERDEGDEGPAVASRTETQLGNSGGNNPATANAPPANVKDVSIGRVLEHYRLEERLGAGGWGCSIGRRT